jgi:uncharacterized Zn-finger protein
MKSNCPYCSGHAVLVGFNDLATTHPAILAEVDGWDATSVTKGSKKQMPWKCLKHGHKWNATVGARTGRSSSCPYCTNHLVLVGFNDMATTHPDLARELHPTKNGQLTANNIVAGTGETIWWIHNSEVGTDHEWQAKGSDRVGRLSGCPYCSGRRVLAGFNDLATTHPDIAAETDEWDATTVTKGSHKKMPWKCLKHGHTWSAAVGARTGQNQNCPYCSGNLVLSGFNDLATTHPEIAAQLHPAKNNDLTAAQMSAGSHRLVWWLHQTETKLVHEWRAVVKNRVSNSTGCPSCNEGGGFNPSKPGYLYLLENVATGLLKVGISNVPKRRFRDHATNGLTPLDVQGPYNDGALAQSWERDILAFLRFNGGQFADQIGLEPFDGYTECWLRESFPVTSLAQLKNLVQDAEAA